MAPSPTCMKQIGEAECGYCIYTITGEDLYIGESAGHMLNGKPWSQVKAESVMLPAEESYAPLVTYLAYACQQFACREVVTRADKKLGVR